MTNQWLRCCAASAVLFAVALMPQAGPYQTDDFYAVMERTITAPVNMNDALGEYTVRQ